MFVFHRSPSLPANRFRLRSSARRKMQAKERLAIFKDYLASEKAKSARRHGTNDIKAGPFLAGYYDASVLLFSANYRADAWKETNERRTHVKIMRTAAKSGKKSERRRNTNTRGENGVSIYSRPGSTPSRMMLKARTLTTHSGIRAGHPNQRT